MTADPHIATIQAALRRERLHIEMSDLDKGHEAREFARIDAALAWFDARGAPWAPTAQHIATIRIALNSRRSFWVDLLAKLNETDYDSQELKDGIAEWRKELAAIDAVLQALDARGAPWATADGVPEDVLHWLVVVTTAILDRHEQYSPAIGIAASALVDWMLEQRRAAP